MCQKFTHVANLTHMKNQIKFPRQRHVRDSAESYSSGGFLENLHFTRTESNFFFYRGQNQK